MADVPFTDPLAWRPAKAPSLDELQVIAEEAYRRLPDKFRALCDGLVIHVDDFPTGEVLDELKAETEFDLLGDHLQFVEGRGLGGPPGQRIGKGDVGHGGVLAQVPEKRVTAFRGIVCPW